MPVFLDTSNKRKLYFRSAFVGVLLVALIGGVLFLSGFSLNASGRKEISYQDAAERYHYYYGAANNKKIALTIDDGPNPMAAEDIMSALKVGNTPATFFYIGEKVLRYPNVAREAAAQGFDIESHSFTHGTGAEDSYSRLAFELNAAGYVIAQMTGEEPLFYRPPFLLGIGIDPTVNPYIKPSQDVLWALALGYLPVGSDIDPRDWLATSPEEVISNFTHAIENTQNGHIVLLHEDVNTAKALPELLSYLDKNGYKVVPLAELLTPPQEILLPATLALGDTDETMGGAISKLQWFLYKEKYLDPYALSGIFDEQTASALTNFQVDHKLVDSQNPDPARTGIADSATRDSIYSVSLGEQKMATAPEKTIFAVAAAKSAHMLRSIYLSFFPATRDTLMYLLLFALVFVAVRLLAIVSLLIYGKFHKASLPPLPRRGRYMPGISILISAWNEEENIAATIESAISSYYRKREIIVIDDGSTDKTADEVRAVIHRYPKVPIQLIQAGENIGKARALNLGLKYARYEIITVLDADAVLGRDALFYFARHFADPMVGAVAGKVRTTGRFSILDIFQTLEYAVGQNIDKKAFSNLGAVGIVPGPAGAWRRECVDAAGGFNVDTLVEDQDMTLTLLRQGKKVIYEPRVIAYTETPNTLRNFLKQRFRWVYGTMQCFWKHKTAFVEQPRSVLSLVVLPNVFIYNIFLPLTYPFADFAFFFGLAFGEWKTLVLPFVVFTLFDLLYNLCGVWREPNGLKFVLAVPLQRIVYRPLLYVTVIRGLVRALEGTGSTWNKFAKIGETRRYYLSNMTEPTPEVVMAEATPVYTLPAAYAEFSPQPTVSSLHVLTSAFAEPTSYAKSSNTEMI